MSIKEPNLLSFENDCKLLSYHDADDMPLWFYIRNDFFSFIQEKLQIRIIPHNTRKVGLNTFTYLVRSIIKNVRIKKENYKVALYVPCQGVKENDDFVNRFSSILYSYLSNDTIILEHPPIDWKWYDRISYNDLFFTAPEFTQITVKSKILKNTTSNKSMVYGFIKYICDKAQKCYQINISREESKSITEMITSNHIKYKLYSSWLIKLCRKHNVSCLIMVGASYSHYCDINRLAKKNNIYIAELQHGFITKSGFVYNYGQYIIESDIINKIVPDFFLSYGEWQNNQTNIPYKKKIVIGNSWYNRTILRLKNHEKKDIIYIIGCANDTEKYMKLSSTIQDYFPNYNVVFRPHPIERNEANKLLKKYPYIEIDESDSLYSILNQSYMVVSEISTVLFEAIGLASNIAVWRTDYSRKLWPSHPFYEFNSFEEFINLMDSNSKFMIDSEKYWPKNTMKLYYKFLNSIGVNTNVDE